MKTFRPFIGLILTLTALSSCGLFPPVRTTGSIGIQFDFPDDPPLQERGFVLAAADALGFDLSEAKAFDPATLYLRLTVSGEGMEEPIIVERDFNREDGPILMKVDGIPEGLRLLTLAGVGGNDSTLTQGALTVFVAGGKNTTAVVNMVPLNANPEFMLGYQSTGWIMGGMRDFYSLDIYEPGLHYILLLFGTDPSENSNLFALYDASGAKIQLPASSLDFASPTRGRTPPLSAGTYYLSVTSPYPVGEGGELVYSLYMDYDDR